jgi:phosphoglucosamine mutase
MTKLFGTDGIRGIAHQAPVTEEMGRRLGCALITLLKGKGKESSVVIGRDTRASGEILDLAVARGVMAAGGNPHRVGVIPTPAVAYLTKVQGAGAGVVISASHNPHEYNGFKVFSSGGYKLSLEEEREVEALIFQGRDPSPGDGTDKTQEQKEALDHYLAFLRDTLPKGFSLGSRRVVIDCANGATSRIAPLLLEGLGAEVEVLCASPDGRNINRDCGSEHTETLCRRVLAVQAHVGLAFDGDGDRLIAVDEKGHVLSGDQILTIFAKMLQEQGALGNNLVVNTVMSNMGLGVALDALGIEHVSTKVGDRWVMEAMRERGASLGGEDSGHMIFSDHHTTGDGLLSALQLLLSMEVLQQTLSKLAAMMRPFPQTLVNVPVQNKPPLTDVPEVERAIREAEEALGKKGRVLVRYSGTEPVCRVMVEGEREDEVKEHARRIAKALGKALNPEFV